MQKLVWRVKLIADFGDEAVETEVEVADTIHLIVRNSRFAHASDILYEFRLIDSEDRGFPLRIEAVRLRRHESLEAGHGDDSCAFERRCIA